MGDRIRDWERTGKWEGPPSKDDWIQEKHRFDEERAEKARDEAERNRLLLVGIEKDFEWDVLRWMGLLEVLERRLEACNDTDEYLHRRNVDDKDLLERRMIRRRLRMMFKDRPHAAC